ncbi:capsular polysaccharide export protein, LipB/KpsS family [Acinetobacter terrestris]|uniref:capsular polysaccharide export protein, LipB/KpsS family n=1 Tax=Acinetobacter terrestris TaxID=2529843 RepID=UPI00103EBD86|nr:hypothetical protein [Acinetobacter terrestris]TCB52216.1 hypothetical protein E0H84_13245 [Acinetobacter terrestris]
MYNFFKPSHQVLLNKHFSERQQKFWHKKKPFSENYSFQIHEPFEIFGEDTKGFEKLYLVGDNWTENPDKPIAIIIGCNDWKFGFIADYLVDFRCAFGTRKLVGFNMSKVIFNLDIKPEVAVVWGYTETSFLRFYLNKKKIPIWRVEDGFIRSATLGAAHSTPYSLVIDKTGLYYNGSQSSDIENILNTYDFDTDNLSKDQAVELLKLIKSQKISKYNPPIIHHTNSLKIKKTILVIGQVDNDASLRYGNPNNWSMEDMVRLAKYENPNAEVLYRPHPEVYKGYQKTKFKKNNIKDFAKILTPDEHVIELIERVDHVYTLTSLTGLEALLRGKKVTVLGTPFYAGWGLTDDRSTFERRHRKLSLIELFIGTYLLYPKYLAEPNNSYIGAISAILRIITERHYLISKIEEIDVKNNIESEILIGNCLKEKIKNLSSSDVKKFFDKELSYYNLALPLLLISLSKNDNERSSFLKIFKDTINRNYFNTILLLIEKYYPGQYLTSFWNEMLLDEKSFKAALDIIDLNYDKYITLKFSIESNSVQEFDDEKKIIDNSKSSYFNEELFLEKFEVHIKSKNFIAAQSILNHILLMSSTDKKALIKKAITLSTYIFDYLSVNKISKILNIIDIEYSNRLGVLEEFRSLSFIDDDSKNIIESVSKIAFLKPDKILYTDFLIENKFSQNFSNELKIGLAKSFNLDKEISVRKINGLISLGQYEKAEKLSLKLINTKEEGKISDNDIVILSQAFSYNEKIDQAIEIMENHIQNSGLSSLNVAELMRLYVLKSAYVKSLKLLNHALNKGIEIGEMHRRKCYFGNKMIFEALLTFKELEIANNLSIYFSNKYVNNKKDLLASQSISLINIFGPGDEIRFASIYNKLRNFCNSQEIFIGCSPRLLSLFKNSFIGINFIGVERPRNGDIINLKNYSSVPGSDIHTIIDNNAISIINHSDKFSLVTDLLADFLQTEKDFAKSHYLTADVTLTNKMSNRLEKFHNKILVGLSWRSSLTTSARNEHYLTVSELEPLFSLPNIQFINLQYDECLEEVAWVNSKYPNKLINFEDIDQYNDFDKVAALISCIDLVISPATTVAELAGALGVPTWLFSNSSEIDWRKIDSQGTDIWHNSITIVDVKEKGNKKLLVQEIYNKLDDFSKNYSKSDMKKIS